MHSKFKAGLFWITVALTMLLVISPYVQVAAAEPNLEAILDAVGFPSGKRTLTIVETFKRGTYEITLYAEFAGYHASNNLSWYKVGTSDYNLIFDGPEGGSGYVTPPITKTFTTFLTDDQFGLSLGSPDGRFYSETGDNPDGEQHAKVYQYLDHPYMFLIGFENLHGGGDKDFNDMVVSIKLLSQPVGGYWAPINKTEPPVPWIGLASFLIAVATIPVVYVKHKKKQQN